MIFKESENIFLLYHNKKSQNPLGCWCNSFSSNDFPYNVERKSGQQKEKKSIKQFKNNSVRHRHNKSDANSILPKPVQNIVTSKINFLYPTSTVKINEKISNSQLWISPRKEIPLQQILEKKIQSFKEQFIRLSINNLPEREFELQKRAATEKQIKSSQTTDKKQITSTQTHADNFSEGILAQKQRIQQTKEKNFEISQQLINLRNTTFERGNLFKAVRRSQTIENGYKSESEESVVLQDFQSMMSKIQEDKLQEQEIDEIDLSNRGNK